MSTFAIFLGTTTTGWLQGDERMRSLSLLYLAENALKNVAGILLVTVAGLKAVRRARRIRVRRAGYAGALASHVARRQAVVA